MGFINRRIDADVGTGSHDVDAETEKGGHDVEYIQLFAAWNTHVGQSHIWKPSELQSRFSRGPIKTSFMRIILISSLGR